MAEKRKITKKIISSVSSPEVPAEEVEKMERAEGVEGEKNLRIKRSCHFCQSKTSPSYTDLVALKRFLTDRAKILPKLRSSVCARHQRAVAKHIKYARHLSLLPFVPKV